MSHDELLRCALMWQWSQSLEQAARNLITKYNVTVIVASGNSEEDSCYIAPGTLRASMYWNMSPGLHPSTDFLFVELSPRVRTDPPFSSWSVVRKVSP